MTGAVPIWAQNKSVQPCGASTTISWCHFGASISVRGTLTGRPCPRLSLLYSQAGGLLCVHHVSLVKKFLVLMSVQMGHSQKGATQCDERTNHPIPPLTLPHPDPLPNSKVTGCVCQFCGGNVPLRVKERRRVKSTISRQPVQSRQAETSEVNVWCTSGLSRVIIWRFSSAACSDVVLRPNKIYLSRGWTVSGWPPHPWTTITQNWTDWASRIVLSEFLPFPEPPPPDNFSTLSFWAGPHQLIMAVFHLQRLVGSEQSDESANTKPVATILISWCQRIRRTSHATLTCYRPSPEVLPKIHFLGLFFAKQQNLGFLDCPTPPPPKNVQMGSNWTIVQSLSTSQLARK